MKELPRKYKVGVKTGTTYGAGTDAKLKVMLVGDNKKNTNWQDLDNSFKNDFERKMFLKFLPSQSELSNLSIL